MLPLDSFVFLSTLLPQTYIKDSEQGSLTSYPDKPSSLSVRLQSCAPQLVTVLTLPFKPESLVVFHRP